MTTTGLLRPQEVCQMLGVSRSWLYQAAADGRIPHVRLGSNDGPIRFAPMDIEQWLENARRQWRPGRSRPHIDQPDGEAE
jgi:excisionase family DNA binding protein